MGKIIFIDGTELNINWLGLSSIDSILRIGIPNMDLITAATLFSDTSKTSFISYEFDGDGNTTKTFTGFTDLVSVIVRRDEIEVGLKEE